ncbi:MAG: protein-ADP-ribose hydrolase [Ruminococcus sp.]|nr:protein-ADP-ribose hydrolase [Ruminococcus sp.]
MTQEEIRKYLIAALLKEQSQYHDIEIPADERAQKALLRSLFNIRPPKPARDEFLKIQDAYLQEETRQKGITTLDTLQPIEQGIYLWKGDITTLACDAIVNAANSQMLGCFCPNHGCIDNAIHTFSGVELRQECAKIMSRQGYEEPTGKAKITNAYNLPCKYVLHTVGPIVHGRLTNHDESKLRSCYLSCLKLADEKKIKSVAFCCISTGEFHFPNDRAAEIAIQTVKEYKAQTHSEIEVIFNVFKQTDYDIYRRLLAAD